MNEYPLTRILNRLAEEGVPAYLDLRLIPTLSPTMGAASTDDVSTLLPAETSPISEIMPFQDICGSRYSVRCSMIQIREMVAFPVSELTELPKGWELLGATGGPEFVRAYYQSEAGMLELSQEPDNSPALNTWSVGADAVVESVIVGGVPGEYVQGAWIDPGENAGAVAWDASVPERILRWEVQGIRFTLRFIPAKSMMVAFAAHVALKPDKEVVPISTPHADIDAVGVEAGFLVDEPGWLPERYVFETAEYVPENNLVCLFYGYPNSESIANLVIVESPWTLTLQNILMPPQYYNGAQIDIPVYTETLL